MQTKVQLQNFVRGQEVCVRLKIDQVIEKVNEGDPKLILGLNQQGKKEGKNEIAEKSFIPNSRV